MAIAHENHTDLFGANNVKFEYYPVLSLDKAALAEFEVLKQSLIKFGIKLGPIEKLHVSIDGIICPENDEKVTGVITRFLSTQKPFFIEFSELGYFPGRGGITLKLGVQNADEIKEFNKDFMASIGGKTTKLNLHLTLARYVNREHFEDLKSSEIIFPKSCVCDSVSIYKKQLNAKGAYEVIGKVYFGNL